MVRMNKGRSPSDVELVDGTVEIILLTGRNAIERECD